LFFCIFQYFYFWRQTATLNTCTERKQTVPNFSVLYTDARVHSFKHYIINDVKLLHPIVYPSYFQTVMYSAPSAPRNEEFKCNPLMLLNSLPNLWLNVILKLYTLKFHPNRLSSTPLWCMQSAIERLIMEFVEWGVFRGILHETQLVLSVESHSEFEPYSWHKIIHSNHFNFWILISIPFHVVTLATRYFVLCWRNLYIYIYTYLLHGAESFLRS
jgi:hypothetical protein